MTITLHWWLIPLALFALSLVWARVMDTGYGLDFLPALIVLIGFIGSVMLVIGHFI